MRTVAIAAIAALASLATAACTGDGDAPSHRGAVVEVLAVWEDAEAERFERVLDRFEAATGAAVQYTTTAGEDVATVLDERLAAGTPPDIAVLPQPALVAQYAEEGVLLPIDDVAGDEVAASYADVWRDLGTVDGALYGVWVKAADKSLVWYRIGAFEDAGIVPPDDLDGLGDIADRLSAGGLAAFSVGAGDGWVLTDWFENLYLRIAGPDRYDGLAAHQIPWTDATVVETLTAMARLLAPDHIAGGPSGALAMELPASVEAVFGSRPAAAMVVEGDFVGGMITASTPSELAVDADVFPFPGIDGPAPGVVGGGDAAVLMRSSAAAEDLVRWLATPEAGEAWASQGGFLSPNEDVPLDAYPDELTRRMARAVLDAGDDVRFDLSDLQPVAFGSTAGQGMQAILQDFLRDPGDPAATAGLLEEARVAAGP